jgi:plastocyanin
MRPVQLLAAVTALLALTLAPAVAGAGGGPVKRTVQVRDNYYTPIKLTVPRGSTITWRWPADTGDSHDVTLDKGPKGVKKFESEIAAAEYSYKRRLTVPGTYRILCSLHDEMKMTIVVRR